MYDPPAYQQQKPKGGGGRTLLLMFGIIAGLVLLVCGGGLTAFVIWIVVSPDGGVRLVNEMEPYAERYLADHAILEDGESVKAYYDVTIALNATEAAIITDRRVVYHREDRVSEVALDEIAEVVCYTQPLIGYTFLISDLDGETISVEIAPLNGGERFATVLRNTTGLEVDCAD